MDFKKMNIFLILFLANFISYSQETSTDVFFTLYTRKNPLEGQFFGLNDVEGLEQTNFNSNKKTKIVVHGWLGKYSSNFGILLKNSFLIQYDANVIVVDWSKYSRSVWYNYSRGKVAEVGRAVAEVIDELVKLGSDPSGVHVVGHSLGAHVAGAAGLLSGSEIGRVTGLDPAGPLFSYDDELRIRRESAKFVDIIHTDAYGAGFAGNLGHVDFFPNGGTAIQPGCGIDLSTTRSHQRSFWLFAESIISPGGFIATSCQNWGNFVADECPEDSIITEMGEHVSQQARGSFYLQTNSQTPYARGKSSIHYQDSI